MAKDVKNTLKTPQSTKPFEKRLPFQNPAFHGPNLNRNFKAAPYMSNNRGKR